MIRNKSIILVLFWVLASQVYAAANVPNEVIGVTHEYRNGMTARLQCTSSDTLAKNHCFLEIRDGAKNINLDIDHEKIGYAWRDLTMDLATYGNPFKSSFFVQVGVACDDVDMELVKPYVDADCDVFFTLENKKLVAKSINATALSPKGEYVSEMRDISTKRPLRNRENRKQ
jgi:hypothetical protein